MANITVEEIKKLATLSKIRLDEDEIPAIRKQVSDILSYAERVAIAAQDIEITPQGNVNVFRKDEVIPTDPQPILAQAPEHEHNYFIVPAILKKD